MYIYIRYIKNIQYLISNTYCLFYIIFIKFSCYCYPLRCTKNIIIINKANPSVRLRCQVISI